MSIPLNCYLQPVFWFADLLSVWLCRERWPHMSCLNTLRKMFFLICSSICRCSVLHLQCFGAKMSKAGRFEKQTSNFAKLTHTDTWAVPGHASAACVYRWRKPGKTGRKEAKALTERDRTVTEKKKKKDYPVIKQPNRPSKESSCDTWGAFLKHTP